MRRRHHPQVCYVVERALAFERLERAIEDRQVLRFQPGTQRRDVAATFHIFNRVERVDVSDDAVDLIRVVAEFLERWLDGLIDNFQHAAAREQFVFHQRDVRFDAGRVAVHQKTDCAGRCEHRHLRVAIAVALAKLGRALPSFGSFLFQVSEFIDIGDVVHSATMQIDHFQHRIDIVLRHRFRNAAAPRIVITWKWAHRLRQPRALFVRFAGHDRRDGAAQRAPLHAVVSVSVTHDQRSQIRVTEPERPENVRVLRDFSDGVARVIDHDLLRGDEDARRRFESLDIERAVCCFEFQQIERREIARRVVEEEVLRAVVNEDSVGDKMAADRLGQVIHIFDSGRLD